MFELLLRRPLFRLLWAAGAISLIGDWLGFVAISRLTLDKGGGPLALAAVYAAHVLPQTWAMPITGVVADRFDRRKLLVVFPILQGLFTLSMALAASRGALFPLQVLIVLRATIGAFLPPAETAALRHTVETSELVRANAILGGTWSVAFVLGMALGGAIAVFGPATALVLDATSFFLGALCAAGLPKMMPPVNADDKVKIGISFVLNVPRDLKKAFDHARGRTDLFRAMLGKAPLGIAGGTGWILLNLVADQAKPLGTAAVSLGILQAVRGAGTGIGPIGANWFSRGAIPSRNVERFVVMTAFLSIIVFPWVSSIPAMLVTMAFLWGIGTGANWVLMSSNLQRLAPDAMIGRLASLDELSTTASLVLGTFLGGLLMESGLSMPTVALIGTGLATLLFVWLDQRGATSSRAELAPVDVAGP